MDFLGSPEHWKTVHIDERNNEVVVDAESLDKPGGCPHCGGPTSTLRPHGTKVRKLKDSPVRGKPVTILMKIRRYTCGECNKTSLQPVHGIAPGSNVTDRLISLVATEAIREQIHNVARRAGISTKTVRGILRRYGSHLEKTRMPRMPRVLGVDGVYMKKTECFIMTDLEKRLVVNLLPTATEDGLKHELPILYGFENVEVVVIDMCHKFRRIFQKLIPGVVIVIDRYHVQRYANKSVDAVREAVRAEMKGMCHRKLLRKRWKSLTKQQRRELAGWFRHYPDLRDAYYMKEKFGDIWHSSCSITAQARYNEWLNLMLKCPTLVRDRYKKMVHMIRRWHTYIFNYFDHPYTNAFTERANRRIKQMQREGNGYKFETIRLKLIFGQGGIVGGEEAQIPRQQHSARKDKHKKRLRRSRRKSTQDKRTDCKCPPLGATQILLFPKDSFES